MVQVGRSLYYDLITNIILVDLGDREGWVRQTDIMEDLNAFPELSSIPLTQLRCINLDYGADLQQALTVNRLSFPVIT